MWELKDMIGSKDVAEIAGVGNACVSNWRLRKKDFPEPLVMISGAIPVYSRKEIAVWLKKEGITS